MKTPKRRFLGQLVIAAAIAFIFSLGLNPVAFSESDKLTVRVMTRNMDAGTDLGYITAPGADLPTALTQTLLEVLNSRIPERAALLAAEIGSKMPDLVALQEVSIWHIPTPNGLLVLDQLDLLKTALESQGLHYRVVVIQTLLDIEVPVYPTNNPRFIDQNAILVRSDLPAGHLTILGSGAHLYEHFLSFELPVLGGIDVPNGWLEVDVKIRGARFKFVNTHLLSPVPEIISEEAFILTSAVQVQQGNELIAGLSQTSLPVILAGDFNSDAESSENAWDKTPTAGLISSSGYLDAWHYKHPSDSGYTWPLFFEDQLSGTPISPFERIDLIYSKGPVPFWVEQVSFTGSGATPLYTSDHVGVMADFVLENQKPVVPKGGK